MRVAVLRIMTASAEIPSVGLESVVGGHHDNFDHNHYNFHHDHHRFEGFYQPPFKQVYMNYYANGDCDVSTRQGSYRAPGPTCRDEARTATAVFWPVDY
jgi:hypothetical protein